jgi:hypothetical protein
LLRSLRRAVFSLGADMTKNFTRENCTAANERLTYFLRELAEDGYPDDLIADVTMTAGIVLIDEVCGRQALVRHLCRLALTAIDPKANMVTGPKFMK